MKKKKNKILFLCLVFLSVFCITGVAQISITPADKTGFGYPMVFYKNSTIYFCAQYTVSYERRYDWRSVYYDDPRDVCTCQRSNTKMLEWSIKLFSKTVRISGFVGNEIFIWNKDFISYIIQEFKREQSKSTEKALKMLEYTIANSDDNTFTEKNIIDFDNKVIINEKMYYYPLKIKAWVRISVNNVKNFYSMVPKSSWIFYEPNCFDDENENINLLIPLLDKRDVARGSSLHNARISKKFNEEQLIESCRTGRNHDLVRQ